MSKISTCPTCGSKSKTTEKDGVISYRAVQDEEAFKKIAQLKKAMMKYKEKSEALEQELQSFKTNK